MEQFLRPCRASTTDRRLPSEHSDAHAGATKFREINSGDAPKRCSAATLDMAEMATERNRRGAPPPRLARIAILEASCSACCCRKRPGRRAPCLPRNPCRHRRRRVGAVRRRPAAHVHPLRRPHAAGRRRDCQRIASELGGYKEVVVRIEGHHTALAPMVRSSSSRAGTAFSACPLPKRRAAFTPAPARWQCMAEQDEADPIVDIKINPSRPAHRHLPRQRRRRPAHQQDRLGRAHHALAHRHRRRMPGRPQPAQQQGPGHEGADRAHPRESTQCRTRRQRSGRAQVA